jgi:DNA-3-methyladenine glycosylase I
MKTRCSWVSSNPLYIKYHDEEWGVPIHDDRKLFEMLILEGTQAGLGWITILQKRENYRKAFDNFDPKKIAKYAEKKINRLLQDEGIIRNRLKINAAVQNAKSFLEVQKEFGSFDKYIWEFVEGKSIVQNRKKADGPMVKTNESDLMSRELKKREFKFVGSTICCAYMHACEMVNDHTTDC